MNVADIDSRLIKLYKGNSMEPLWIQDGKPDTRASEVLAVLKGPGPDNARATAPGRCRQRTRCLCEAQDLDGAAEKTTREAGS